MSEIYRFLSMVRVADVLDIVVIAGLLYVVARWLLHRASWAVAMGLTLVLALNLTAQMLSMYLTLAVFRVGAVLIVVVLAIVFQDDIRRGIDRLAAWRPGRRNGVPRPMHDVKETLVSAVNELAARRLGALIVLTGRQPLEAHVRGGIPLHGDLSFPLLLSIFDHRTPGHDGAVLLDGPAVSRFGVHLPLSKNLAELEGRGTRHAAALGLSEWCDAMVIVVSEERGTVSVAEGGTLTKLDSATELSEFVDAFYTQYEHGKSDVGAADRAADWSLKTASLLAACMLWSVFAYRVDRVERVFDNVAVEYRNLPQGYQVERIEPAAVQLTLSGPERAFDQLDRSSLRVSLDMNNYSIEPGEHEIRVSSDEVKLPRGVTLAPGDPPIIELTLDRVVRLEATVQPRLIGSPALSHRLGSVSVVPQKLQLSVPSRRASRARTLPTEPIQLNGVDASFTKEVKILLPQGTTVLNDQGDHARVNVEIVPREPRKTEER